MYLKNCSMPLTACCFLFCLLSLVAGEEKIELQKWKFSGVSRFDGWLQNAFVKDVEFEESSVSFQTSGHDPLILSPLFTPFKASNSQWVELDIDCSAPGEGELFYTNKTTGRYGGFESRLRCKVIIPSAGRQVVCAWPFWQELDRIIRIRFDPPSGIKCHLFSVRILEPGGKPVEPFWDFETSQTSWQAMYGSKITHSDGQLHVHALNPQAMIITRVKPFKAESRSIFRLEAECPGETFIGFYWSTKETPGLFGEPVFLKGRQLLDLRSFPAWQGTVTQLAIAFGTFGTETLSLGSLSIEKNDPKLPFLRLKEFDFDRAINRRDKPALLRITLEHAAGPKLVGCDANLFLEQKLPGGRGRAFASERIPTLSKGERFTFRKWLPATGKKSQIILLDVNNRLFRKKFCFDEIVDKSITSMGDYIVPAPKKVVTKYQVGVYYFPGWSPDQFSRWKKQAEFPERDPVLGWYDEGNPEVSDWHIKWAVENCISFFIFDWYWKDGAETLSAALNNGFLKARYCEKMKFAIMWANHKPFSNHTPRQLLTVVDYWIKKYFKKKNYLTLDGKPYVSFFQPRELISCLGSEDNVRKAFQAMRERAKSAGLAGLHIAACQGIEQNFLQSLKAAGFDSVTGYNYIETGTLVDQCSYRQFLLGHKKIWRQIEGAGVLPYVPLLAVGWDSRPWHGMRAKRKFARNSMFFTEGLKSLKLHLDSTGKKMAILEAWNEWGEGSYIEPDREFGFKNIEAVRKVFGEPGKWPVNICPDDMGLKDPYDLRRKDRFKE